MRAIYTVGQLVIGFVIVIIIGQEQVTLVVVIIIFLIISEVIPLINVYQRCQFQKVKSSVQNEIISSITKMNTKQVVKIQKLNQTLGRLNMTIES